MEILVLAQTQPKDSWTEIGLTFYKQYAVGHNLTESEREHFAKFYRLDGMYGYTNPVITMRRRVDIRNGLESCWEWDYFDCFESVESAARGFADTEYWKVENSVIPLHKSTVEHVIEQDNIQKQLQDLEYYKSFTIRQKYNDLYTAELKSKRLYTKASQGIAPQDKIDSIKADLLKQYTEELAEVQSRIDTLHDKLGR